ncbi:hypothetical protein [Stenotrophomonas phage BUCT627]|uniref:Uncharacterized protein n=1 Tax=Stenotrophomonas phage BUCT627 TaxID=2860377 RepID=A0AC61NMI7_9CAUD|nr:hypothetical protein PQD77_gp010 [Stenotrophomonas phage BUCT627]QYC96616.1 hypothetical protein [Stenotrophomonas phage BUCT627]
MKASELIHHLAALIAIHGDCEVFANDGIRPIAIVHVEVDVCDGEDSTFDIVIDN